MIILLSADFFIPMRQLGSFFHVAMNGMAASDKIFRLLDLPETEEKTGCFPMDCDIVCTGLRFSYDGNSSDGDTSSNEGTHLFHDSIKNNLRIAKPDAADGKIEAACRKASVHDFIMSLPEGYDTPVGELGDTLSGGERQRLGLARAFLHNAPFLLLDEPTSNLDSLNEAVILKSLHEEREGKTVLIVSHRQSTMRIADTVYSVESLKNRHSSY